MVVLAVVVLVDYRVTLATGDEPAVDREGRPVALNASLLSVALPSTSVSSYTATV